jgi:6,7-dimethyl-8-ribityllumazine synthase
MFVCVIINSEKLLILSTEIRSPPAKTHKHIKRALLRMTVDENKSKGNKSETAQIDAVPGLERIPLSIRPTARMMNITSRMKTGIA